MSDSNTRENGEHSNAFFDLGYTLYKQQSRLIFVPMLVGFAAAICLYGLLSIADVKTWRIYFKYFPLAIGLGTMGIAMLVNRLVCPVSKRVVFEKVLTSVKQWRELDARNKARVILGAFVAIEVGFLIGWVIGGWARYIFQ